MKDKYKDYEIINIIYWIIGYVRVIEGHPKLKEETERLYKLILVEKGDKK